MSFRPLALRGALALTTAAGLAVAAPTPASAATPLCFGPPSIPAAYVCYTPAVPTVVDVRDEGETVTVPGICYGIGCTDDIVTAVPSTYVYLNNINAGTITYMGRSYAVGVSTTATICDNFELRYVHCVD